MANSWLHTGSLVCPSCQDVCGEQFAAQGQRCKPGVLPPKNHVYYEEGLPCSAPKHLASILVFVLAQFVVRQAAL
jgi:leishmanolysin-like peptidase